MTFELNAGGGEEEVQEYETSKQKRRVQCGQSCDRRAKVCEGCGEISPAFKSAVTVNLLP